MVRRRLERVVAAQQVPRRRGQLPSPAFVGELVEHRHELARLADPRRLGSVGTLGDHERLIGLLMVRSENDILDEHLRLATRFFDRILVLDGTPAGPERDECRRILASYHEVRLVLCDDDLGLTGPPRDGIRGVLLNEARRRWGVDNWIGILHADELHLRDPRPLLAALNPLRHPCVRVRLAHYFLHPDDPVADQQHEQEHPHSAGSVLDRVTNLMWPGLPETRFFFDSGIRDYELDRHSKVVPRSMRTGELFDGYVLPQLNFRSAAQAHERAVDRVDRGWQSRHYAPIIAGASVAADSLDLHADPMAGGKPDPLLGPARPVRADHVILGPRRRDTIVPIFVGGTGRCGSTLVKRLLAEQLGATAATTEWKALSWPAGLFDQAEHPSRRRLARLERNLHDHAPMVGDEEEGNTLHNWGARLLDERPAPPGYAESVDLLLRVLRSALVTPLQRRRAVADFIAGIWEHTVPAASTIWVEHTPADVEIADALLNTFPTGHCVFVRRHPLDIVASLVARTWGPTTVEEACRHILRVEERWTAARRSLRGEVARCHEVRFEDVLADPLAALAPLAEALGLTPATINAIESPARAPRTADDLAAHDRALALELLAPMMRAWGYDA